MTTPTSFDPIEAILDALPQYALDPSLAARELIGVELDPWQADTTDAVFAALRGEPDALRYVSVRSGHGPGKTGAAALAAVIALAVLPGQVKIVLTAPTAAQLYDALFAEIVMWFRRLPPEYRVLFTLLSDRIELASAPEQRFLTVRTSSREKPDALQGIHAETVFLIVDEAPGVDEAVFEASGGSMSGERACMLLLGNPTRTSGYFWASHNLPGFAERFVKFQVNSENVPRVSREFIAHIAAMYGIDSDQYRVRIKGEFPRGDVNTLIARELVTWARKRDIVPGPNDPRVWGIDPARFGDDVNGFVERTARAVLEVEEWTGLDMMETVGRVKAKWDARPPSLRPVEILVDVIGLGAGVADRLRELGLPVRDVNVSESPTHMNSRGYRLRDDLWCNAREWFAERQGTLQAVSNTYYDKLANELAAPTYTHSSDGRIRLESKDQMRKRGIKSPNLADAFVLTFHGHALAKVGTAGTSAWGGSRVPWGTAIKRNVGAVV